MVHGHDPLDAVRRTVARAARPALAPLRAAAVTLQVPGVRQHGHEPPPVALAGDTLGELEELAAMRDQLAGSTDHGAADPDDRAQRATRSASAYLEARRARLRRELRELEDQV